MRFAPHTTTNIVLRGDGASEISDLPVTLIVRDDGIPTLSSFWLPDALELAALNAGGAVCLTVFGRQHPPVAVGVVDAEGIVDTIHNGH